MIARLDSRTRTFSNIQGLRAIAALLVFAVHLNGVEHRFTPGEFLHLLNPLGEWGVDLFFVISGFVMITSTWNEFATPAISMRFFLRRLTRVYPPYWIAMIPIVALYAVAPHMINGSQSIRPNVIASLLLLPQAGKPLLTVSWTLVYEMFFYVVFALVLAFDRRWCLPLMTVWGGFTLLVAAIVTPLHNPYLHVYANPLLIEFILGVFAGYVVQVRGAMFPITSLILGGALMAASDVFYDAFDSAAGLGGDLRFLFVGVPVLLLFNGAIGLETRFSLLFPGWMQRIGNASFSLYLWHVPLSILIARATEGLLARHPGPLFHLAWLSAIVVVVVGSSQLLYAYVERPLLRRTSRWIRRLEASGALQIVPSLQGGIRAIKSVSPW
jgi:peptidoglycan/LPS O-acetylase OafA/YrhL